MTQARIPPIEALVPVDLTISQLIHQLGGGGPVRFLILFEAYDRPLGLYDSPGQMVTGVQLGFRPTSEFSRTTTLRMLGWERKHFVFLGLF